MGMYGHGHSIPSIVPQSGGVSLLLDKFPSFNAYSNARKLRASYLGDANNVRESNLNAELGIGFDANGDLDEAALLAHTGVNNGLIVDLFDQQGSFDITNTTAANQPAIVTAGVVEKILSKPSANNTLDAGWQNTGTYAINGGDHLWMFAVVQVPPSGTRILLETSPDVNANTGAIIWNLDALNFKVQYKLAGGLQFHKFDFTSFIGTNILLTVKMDVGQLYANAIKVWVNGSLQTNTEVTATGNPIPYLDSTFNFGSRNIATAPWNDFITEGIFYNTNQDSNRVAIETDINDYYSIF